MDRLLDLQHRLQTAGAALGRLESELPRHPDSRGLQSNILSLRKLHTTLERDFKEAANQIGLDVFRYRLLDDRPTARALAKVIGSFQDAFSLAYDALRHGPKPRRNLSQLALLNTELRIAYTFPGSFGVVMTIASERLSLFPELPTHLDEATNTLFKVARAQDNTDTVRQVARDVGRAPLAAIYDWAKANAQSGIGAAIEWTRQEVTKGDVTIQAPEFKALSKTIELTSDKTELECKFNGFLVGADVQRKSFRFLPDGQETTIHGYFEDAISESHQATLPARYTALVKQTSQITYATEIENLSYFLLSLTAA